MIRQQTDQGNEEGPSRVIPASRQLPAILKEAMESIRQGACTEGDDLVRAMQQFMVRMGVQGAQPPQVTEVVHSSGSGQNETMPSTPVATTPSATGPKDKDKLHNLMSRGPYYGDKTK